MLQHTKPAALRKTPNRNNSSDNNIETSEFISYPPEIEQNNSFSEEEELIPNVSNISPIAPTQSPQPTIQEKEKHLSNISILNSSGKRNNSHSIINEDDDEHISLPLPPSIVEDNNYNDSNKTRNSKNKIDNKRNSIKKNLTSHFESVANEDDLNNDNLEDISFTTTGSTTKKRGRPSKTTTTNKTTTSTKDTKKNKNKNKSNTSYLSYSSFRLDDDDDDSKTIDNDESDFDYSYRSPNITTNDEESILSLQDDSINDDDDKLVSKRTPRKRFPPLQYWKGEHLFISKSKVEKVKYGVETPEKKYIHLFLNI